MWCKKEVVTLILLEIASAFPNAVTSHLQLNMWHLGYPTQITGFVEVMLQYRHTYLFFDRFTSEEIDIDNGIGQGDASSMILYLIYSYGLVTITDATQGYGG